MASELFARRSGFLPPEGDFPCDPAFFFFGTDDAMDSSPTRHQVGTCTPELALGTSLARFLKETTAFV